MKTLYSRREESFFESEPLIAEMQLQTVQLEMSRAKKKKKKLEPPYYFMPGERSNISSC